MLSPDDNAVDFLMQSGVSLVREERNLEVTATDFRRHYEMLSDEALLETDRGDLVELARQCFDEEVSRRGLNAAEDAAESSGEAGERPALAGEELVPVATFLSGDELTLARGLLDEASIPYHVVNPLAALGGIELRLMVPAALEEQAREILASEISDEELAAQAEAAGMLERELLETDVEEEANFEEEAELPDAHD